MGLFSKMKVPLPKGMKKENWKQYFRENKKQVLLILAAFIAIVAAFSVGIKSIFIMAILIGFASLTAVVMTYTQINLLSDFTLFGGIVGTYLFGPWFGLLTLAASYAITSRFVSIEQIDFPVGVWYAIVLLFVFPKIGFDSTVLKLMILTMIGEIGNFVYWFARGTPPPYLVMGAIVKFGWYLAFFLIFLPKITAFLA